MSTNAGGPERGRCSDACANFGIARTNSLTVSSSGDSLAYCNIVSDSGKFANVQPYNSSTNNNRLTDLLGVRTLYAYAYATTSQVSNAVTNTE